MNKCIKGESCLHCDTDYCRFKDEVAELKAECEKLKSWLDKAEQEQKKFIDKNRELKQQVKTLNYMLFDEKEMSKNEYTLKYKLADKERRWTQYKHLTKGKLDKYKQALQEIRDIAENVCRDDCPDLKNGYCIGLGECSFRARKQIIAKINSVIGAE